MHVTSEPAWTELNVPFQDSIDRVAEEIPLTAAEQARSAANVASWISYLPLDCVLTMIALDWDIST